MHKPQRQLAKYETLTKRKCNLRDRKPVSVLATIPTSDTDQSTTVQCSIKTSGTWEKRDFAIQA